MLGYVYIYIYFDIAYYTDADVVSC